MFNESELRCILLILGPSAPTAVEATALSTGIRISWTPTAQGSSLTHKVIVSPTDGGDSVFSDDVTATTVDVTSANILPSTSYTVSVQALLETPDSSAQSTLTGNAGTTQLTTGKLSLLLIPIRLTVEEVRCLGCRQTLQSL